MVLFKGINNNLPFVSFSMLIVIDNEVMSNQYEDGMKKLEIRGLRVIRYCLIMTMIIIA